MAGFQVFTEGRSEAFLDLTLEAGIALAVSTSDGFDMAFQTASALLR